MNKLETYIETEQARSVIYNIFSALYCQPDKEITHNPLVYERLTKVLQVIYPDLSSSIVNLKTSSDKYSDTELLIEYSRLFIGPFKTLAPPYSSVYLGNKNSVYSEDTIWVIQFYNKAGLDYNRDIHDLPDHIAVELEFIYFLLFNEIKQLKENNSESAESYHKHQTEFNDAHFKKWVPVFCDKIIAETENDYYQLLAECLKSFIKVDTAPDFPEI